MKIWINLFLILVILVVVGNIFKRIQDNQRAQEEAANQITSDPDKPKQFTQEQWELVQQANTVPKEIVTPIPTLPGSPSQCVEGRAGYRYLCYQPHGYQDEENKEKKFPLIIFLHGQNSKGENLQALKSYGPILELQMREDPNFLCAAPLCPANGGWISPALDTFLNHVIERFRVDTDRIYLTGISMGGHGTWSWAQESPKRFAAIAPLCGAGNPQKAKKRLKNIGVWVFHGALDDVVPVERGIAMIRALEAVGGNIRSTIFPDQGHGIGGVYQRPELYIWFLTQSKDPKKSILYREPETISSATEVVPTPEQPLHNTR